MCEGHGLQQGKKVIAAIQEEWDQIGTREFALYIKSMPCRMQQVTEAGGGPMVVSKGGFACS